MAVFEHDGSSIYYEEHGSGEPVLLLPGFAQSIDEFAGVREALVSAGYRVIAADLPGSGNSGPQPRAYTVTYYEDDARSFAALLRHLETGPTHLVGHSDGGEVSLLMAAMTPELARSAVTWGSAGAVNESHLPMLELFDNVIDNPAEFMVGFSTYLTASYGEDNARSMTRNFANANRALIERGEGISLTKVGNIACPVLLIAGEQDFFVTPQMLTNLAALIPGAEMHIVNDAGHGVHADKPEWFNQTLLDWLRRH